MTAKRPVSRPKDSSSKAKERQKQVRAGVETNYPSEDEEDDVPLSMLAKVTGPPQAPSQGPQRLDQLPPVKKNVRP